MLLWVGLAWAQPADTPRPAQCMQVNLHMREECAGEQSVARRSGLVPRSTNGGLGYPKVVGCIAWPDIGERLTACLAVPSCPEFLACYNAVDYWPQDLTAPSVCSAYASLLKGWYSSEMGEASRAHGIGLENAARKDFLYRRCLTDPDARARVQHCITMEMDWDVPACLAAAAFDAPWPPPPQEPEPEGQPEPTAR